MAQKPQSAGGKATAIILRKKAIDTYYLNPSICKCCNTIIKVEEGKKIRLTKKKVFCSKSCSVIFYNKQKEFKKEENKKLSEHKKKNKISIQFNFLSNMTKKDLFIKYKNYQSARSKIQKHARYVFEKSDKKKCCLECGYDKHYEVCHVQPVSSFKDDESIVNDINNINNLLAYCPTHHWEFDNGFLNKKTNT